MKDEKLLRKLKVERVAICLNCRKFLECTDIGRFEECADFVEVEGEGWVIQRV
jgi:hypothetical protein